MSLIDFGRSCTPGLSSGPRTINHVVHPCPSHIAVASRLSPVDLHADHGYLLAHSASAGIPQNYLRYFVKCREYLENARNLTIVSNQTAKISFCRSRETVSVCGRHNCYGHSVQLVMNDQKNLLPSTTHLLRVSVTKTSPPETYKSSHDKSPPELTTPGSCSLPIMRVSKTMLVTPLLTLPVSTAGRNRLHWQDYATRAEPNLS